MTNFFFMPLQLKTRHTSVARERGGVSPVAPEWHVPNAVACISHFESETMTQGRANLTSPN